MTAPAAQGSRRFGGRVAAITGAASGMGRALAVELARRGCHLALSDIDDAGLADTARLAAAHGVTITLAHVDTRDRAAIVAWAIRVVIDHEHAHPDEAEGEGHGRERE